MRPLALHRLIVRASLALSNVFAWLFLFTEGYRALGSRESALFVLCLLYVLTQALTILFAPLCGRMLARGVRRLLLYGTLSAALSFVALLGTLYAFDAQRADLALVGGLLFSLFQGLYRASYKIPYATAVAEYASTGSGRPILREIVLATLPILGGLLATLIPGGPQLALAVSAFALSVSTLPLLLLEESYEHFSYSYEGTFSALLSRRERDSLMRAVKEGAQGMVLLILWPLVIFVFISGSYALVGCIFTASLLAGLLLKLIRPLNVSGSSARVYTLLSGSVWLLRLGVASPIAVVFTDAVYQWVSPVRRIGFDALAHEQAADLGHWVDEHTAQKEMGQAAGRGLAAAVIGVFAIMSSFTIAAAAGIVLASFLSFALLRKREA